MIRNDRNVLPTTDRSRVGRSINSLVEGLCVTYYNYDTGRWSVTTAHHEADELFGEGISRPEAAYRFLLTLAQSRRVEPSDPRLLNEYFRREHEEFIDRISTALEILERVPLDEALHDVARKVA